MAKKKSKIKKNFKPYKWIIVVLTMILFLIFLNSIEKISPIKIKPNLIAKPQAIQSAQPTPSPTPTPKPLEILTSQVSVGIPVLTYHYIGNNPDPKDKARDALEVSPDKFDEQMQYLASSRFTPVTLDTMYAILNKQIAAPSKPVVLTFDDGYIDFYTNAFPILKRFNFHGVSFIPTGLIGKGYYMSWDQIKEIQASGLINFEDHTVTHANLAGLSFSDALKQMIDSKNFLQSQTGYPVNFIAYPYGISNEFVHQAAKQAGFLGGLGTYFGKVNFGTFNMPRIKVSGSWSIAEFAARL